MLQKSLNEIQIMTSKIQQTVSKAIQQSQKQIHQSPQTHYRSNNITQGTTGHKYKKTNHSKSSSDHRNSQNNFTHIMEQQNQILKEELWRQKQKGKGYRQKLRQMKSYIQFLQKYNNDLKKQVVLWMTRPAKKQGYSQEQVKHKFEIYRNKLNDLKSQSLHQNYSTQIQPNSYTVKNIRGSNNQFNNQFSNGLLNNKKTEKIQHKSYIDDDDLYKAAKTNKIQYKNKAHKINNPLIDDEKICTSCNYLGYINKQYIYKKKKSENNISKNKKGHKVSLSTSLNLKGNKSYHLCQCHQNYLKTRKF